MIELQILSALENYQDFKVLVKTHAKLMVLSEQFPQHAQGLINIVLTEPEEFKRLIQDTIKFVETAKQFPQHAESLINIILTQPEEFSRLIEEYIDLLATVKQFPKHAEKLINIILMEPQQFRRLIKTNDHLSETARQFPHHAEIFGKATISKAIESSKLYTLKRESFLGIRMNSRILSQGQSTTTGLCFFQKLPSELLVIIAGLTRNKIVHSEDEANDIAYAYLGRPRCH